MTVQTTVTNHLHLINQFCGFERSLGLSYFRRGWFPTTQDLALRQEIPLVGFVDIVATISFEISFSRSNFFNEHLLRSVTSYLEFIFVAWDSNEFPEVLEVCWDMIHLWADDVEKILRICLPFMISVLLKMLNLTLLVANRYKGPCDLS